MAEAPSLRISTWSSAAIGIDWMSTPFAPAGAVRRPLINVSVRLAPRPRSEISETELAPPWPPPAPVLATSCAPSVEVTETVLSNCSEFETPARSMSSRLKVSTGSAVWASIRLIDEPVTSNFWSCTVSPGLAADVEAVVAEPSGTLCATAGEANNSEADTTAPKARVGHCVMRLTADMNAFILDVWLVGVLTDKPCSRRHRSRKTAMPGRAARTAADCFGTSARGSARLIKGRREARRGTLKRQFNALG